MEGLLYQTHGYWSYHIVWHYGLGISLNHVYNITLGFFFLLRISIWPFPKTTIVSLIIFLPLVKITCSIHWLSCPCLRKLQLLFSAFFQRSITQKVWSPQDLRRHFINLCITSIWYIVGIYVYWNEGISPLQIHYFYIFPLVPFWYGSFVCSSKVVKILYVLINIP